MRVLLVDFKSKDHAVKLVNSLESIKAWVKPQDFEHIKGLESDNNSTKRGVISTYTIFAERVDVNENNYVLFKDTFARILKEEMQLNPEMYLKDYDTTLNNCLYALLKSVFNKDTESFKRTCKEIKVKYTYKAIKEFIYGTM